MEPPHRQTNNTWQTVLAILFMAGLLVAVLLAVHFQVLDLPEKRP